MTFKKAIGKLHLWLGLSSGLIVFVVSLTGAILAFADDIRDVVEPYRWAKAPEGATPLPPSRLRAALLEAEPLAKPSWTFYFGPGRSAVVYYSDSSEGNYVATIDPYTAKVLHLQDMRRDFFAVVQAIHMYLLIPQPYGDWVVGIAVVVFLIMLVTGLVLWWPKRRQDRQQRLTIKWRARWRRLNYDLHQVLGFYAASIAFIIGLTGLFMVFHSWLEGAGWLINGGKSLAVEEAVPTVDTTQPLIISTEQVIDKAYYSIRKSSPDAEMMLLGTAEDRKQSVFCMTYLKSLHYYHRDEYYFDPRSGQMLKAMPHSGKSPGKKLHDLNYDVHVGIIFGTAGKILAFVVSLISASLPVTGVMLWWGRRHKKPKAKSRKKRMAIPIQV